MKISKHLTTRFPHTIWRHDNQAWYGRYLLRAAEKEAGQRGCKAAHLKTFSFQARGFYEKQGYQIIGQLDDYPPGETFFWLRKNLSD